VHSRHDVPGTREDGPVLGEDGTGEESSRSAALGREFQEDGGVRLAAQERVQQVSKCVLTTVARSLLDLSLSLSLSLPLPLANALLASA